MPGARPRRSTAALVDYTAFLPPRESSSSSNSSSDSDSPAAPTASNADAGPSTAPVDPSKPKTKKERLKKRKQFIPSAASESEFDAAAVSSPDEAEDEEDEEEAGASSSDAGGGGARSDVSGSVVDVHSSGSERGGGYSGRGTFSRRGRGRGGGRRKSAAAITARQNASNPIYGTAGASSSSNAPPRTRPPGNWRPQSGWDPQYVACGPLVTLAPSATLSSGTGGIAEGEREVLNGGGNAKGKGKEPLGSTDTEVSKQMESWTANPFLGPSRGSARDHGWGKGKWVRSQGDEGEGERWEEAEKWGGWYEEPEEGESGEVVDEKCVSSFFSHPFLPVP
jgi:hypothetical protein